MAEGDRGRDGGLDLPVGGKQIVAETLSQSRQGNVAAGPFEQRASELAFQFLDRLADPARGHPQAGGGPAEMQFLGEREECLRFEHRYTDDRRRAPLVAGCQRTSSCESATLRGRTAACTGMRYGPARGADHRIMSRGVSCGGSAR